MYKEVWEALETILTWLISTTKLNKVFNYDVKKYTGFPCATISPLDWDNLFFDSANDELLLQYRVRIVDQNVWIAAMEPRIRQLADEIITELSKKSNAWLNWTVCSFTMWVSWWWLDDQMPTRICDLNINARIITSII